MNLWRPTHLISSFSKAVFKLFFCQFLFCEVLKIWHFISYYEFSLLIFLIDIIIYCFLFNNFLCLIFLRIRIFLFFKLVFFYAILCFSIILFNCLIQSLLKRHRIIFLLFLLYWVNFFYYTKLLLLLEAYLLSFYIDCWLWEIKWIWKTTIFIINWRPFILKKRISAFRLFIKANY